MTPLFNETVFQLFHVVNPALVETLLQNTRGMVELPPEYHPVPRYQPAARGHSQQFQHLQPSVDAYKYAFFPRTIPVWNALPVELVETIIITTTIIYGGPYVTTIYDFQAELHRTVSCNLHSN